jgi:hypothetical protein
MQLFKSILSLFILLSTASLVVGQQVYDSTNKKIIVLDTVVIKESPIIHKKDTTEYNASRFPTRDYAALSELLQLLPGIRLNNDGTLTINGQQIDRIMVDGKPFFDGSPQTALEHLPADIVKKIQMFASKNPNSMGLPLLSGQPGPKTLNILLKAGKQKGDFGKVIAGAGTDNAYTSNADLNHMNGGQQISLIEDAGNAGSDNMIDPNINGITRRINGGINYRDSRSEKTSVNGSVQASDTHNDNVQRSRFINIYTGDSSVIQNLNMHAVTNANVQSANINIDHNPDQQNIFSFQPRLSIRHSNTTTTQQGAQQNAATGDTVYTNSGNANSNNKNTIASALLQYTHRWKQPAQNLSLGVNINSNNGEHDINTYTDINMLNTVKDQHLYNNTSDKALSIAPFINYVMPVGEKNLLNVQGNYADSRDDMSYRVYSGKNLNILDTTQSNDYLSNYQTANMQFSFRRQWKMISLQAGTGIEADWLSGDNQTANTKTTRHFLNPLPAVTFTMTLAGNKSINASYTGKPVSVSVQQLQPVAATSDSLFIQEGNPDLLQPYMHSMNISYTAGNVNQFSAAFSMNATMHSIQESLTLLDHGVQVSKPVNIDGEHAMDLALNYSIPALDKKYGYTFSARASYSKVPVLSNGSRNDGRIFNVAGNLTWSYVQREGMNFSLTASPGYNTIQTEAGTDSEYFTGSFNGKCSYFHGDWSGTLMAYYVYNSSLPAGYGIKYPITISSVSYRFLQHKQAEVKLSVSDLFNQQSGIKRSITASSISDVWTKTRGRYMMCTFTYNFRKFPGKK